MAEESGDPTSSDLPGDPLYARAVSLATKGYSVFPAQVTRHADGTKDVRPWDHWADNSTTDLDTIAWWFRDGHTWTDVCIDCGKSGIVVVDLDVRDDGDGRQAWRELIEDHGDDQPVAGRVHHLETPSGGRHLYFRNDPRELIGSRNGAWEHVDVKGAGGMVFAYGYVPKPEALPLRPAWLAERVKVVGGSERSVSGPGGASADSSAVRTDVRPDPDGFSVPSQMRAFTKAQAEAFCAPAWGALTSAARGTINERLNEAAVVFSHFVPEFWSAADVEGWLIEGQRQAWVAAGGRDDGDYGAATATIRSGLGQSTDPWRAIRAADAPAAFGGRPDPEAEPPTGDAMDEAVARLMAKLLDVDGLASLPPPVPLVEGWLFRDTVARLNGRPGGGKSVLALDLAASVGTGRAWRNAEVSRGRVVYIVAEGASGQLQRVKAWERWNETRVTGVRFLPEPVQVADAIGWGVLVEACRRMSAEDPIGLVIVDTQARVTEGMEENSAKEMGILIGQCERLRAATGACVLLVHHTGHGGERGRGSSAVLAGVTTELLLESDDERDKSGTIVHRWRDLRVLKQKDGDDSLTMRMELTAVELGTDVRGKAVTSVVLSGGDGFDTPGERRWLSDADLEGNTARLAELFAEVFTEGRGGTKSEVHQVVRLRDLMSKAGFYRAWNRLLEGGRIAKVQGTQSFLWVDETGGQSHETAENVTERV